MRTGYALRPVSLYNTVHTDSFTATIIIIIIITIIITIIIIIIIIKYIPNIFCMPFLKKRKGSESDMNKKLN